MHVSLMQLASWPRVISLAASTDKSIQKDVECRNFGMCFSPWPCSTCSPVWSGMVWRWSHGWFVALRFLSRSQRSQIHLPSRHLHLRHLECLQVPQEHAHHLLLLKFIFYQVLWTIRRPWKKYDMMCIVVYVLFLHGFVMFCVLFVYV